MTEKLDFGSFADPDIFVADIFKAILPPTPVDIADWTADKRYLNNPGAFVGRWNHDYTPYLVEPLRSLTSGLYSTTAVVGPGQVAKTVLAENWLAYSVDQDPMGFLWYMQTEQALEAYVKKEIRKLIDEHKLLSSRLGPLSMDDTLHYKNFGRLIVEFLSASYKNLISKKAPRIIADEIDAWLESLGDPRELLDVRRSTFINAMMLLLSHPDRAEGLDPEKDWNKGIMSYYRDSTRGIWYWLCPNCRKPSTPNPVGAKVNPDGSDWHMPITWVEKSPDQDLDEVAATAHMICPHCHEHEITDVHRWDMNLTGQWVHRGQDILPDGEVVGDPIETETYGVWIVGAMSNLRRNGIVGMVRARVAAERRLRISEDEPSRKALKEVLCKTWGFPAKVENHSKEALDPEDLKKRASELPRGVVPAWCRFLIVAIDTQKSSWVVQVEAFGPDLESHILDRFDVVDVIEMPDGSMRNLNPASYIEDWKILEERVVEKRWPVEGGGYEMAPQLIAYDSGGADGVTDNAYAFWRQQREAGRGNWVMPLKGQAGFAEPRQSLSYPDTHRKDKYVGARGEVPVFMLKTALLKDDADKDLRREYPGPRYVHFARNGDPSNPDAPPGMPHNFWEEFGAERREDKDWHRIRARNESLVLAAYTRGLLLAIDADLIDWDNPPSWAAPFEENDLVTEVEGERRSPALQSRRDDGGALDAIAAALHAAD